MLSIMRKKAGSWMLKIILGIIAVVFVFWGIGGENSRRSNVVASVNGEPITLEEYRAQYNDLVEDFRRSLGENFDDELIKSLNLEDRALESLIERKIMLMEAEQLNLRVTDEELAATIMSMPSFQKGGRFDERAYRQVLNYARLTPEIFETMQKEAILIGKLKVFIEGSAKVSEKEAREWFQWQQAEVNINFVEFNPQNYKNRKVNITGEEIQAFYEKNKSAYRIDPRIKVQFVKFPQDDYRRKVNIDAAEIDEYYISNRAEFDTPKTVEARHILIKVEAGADKDDIEKARQRAEAIMKLARDGKNFARLAEEYSEGPSRENGGYLGTFQKNSMVEPFAEKAFLMKAGEISDPVRTQFGWHVIKVEKINQAVTLPEKEAKHKIRQRLIRERAKNLAYDDAEELFDLCLDVETLEQAVAQKNLTLFTTNFFSKSDTVQNVINPSKFRTTAFELSEGEISDIQDFGDSYYILQVVGKNQARIPVLEEIQDKVYADMKKEKTDQMARRDAAAFLEALKDSPSGMSMNMESGKYNRTPVSTGFFKRNDKIPQIGYEAEISRLSFTLFPRKPLLEEVVKGSRGYYVIQLKARKEPDMKDFPGQKTEIIQKILEHKKSSIFNSWLSKAKQNNEIEIEDEFKKAI